MTTSGTSAIAKIESRLVVEQASALVPDECWLFTGARTGPRSQGGRGGYGQVKVPGDPVPKYVHRIMYEHHVGPIPDRHVLDHRCEITNCARPSHLEPVLHAENIKRHFTRKPARELLV